MSDIQKQKDQARQDGTTFKNLSGVEAQHLLKTNPDEYHRLRDAAGVLPGYRSPGLRISHSVSATPVLNVEEIRAAVRFPKQEAERYLKGASTGSEDNQMTLLKRDPDGARLLRIAGKVHGILERDASTPNPVGDVVAIGEKVGASLGLPADTRVSLNDLPAVLTIAAAVEAARQ
jgi:hypothetical protein